MDDVFLPDSMVALLSGGGVVFLAKYLLSQSIRKLDSIPKDLNEIRLEIAKMSVHLTELARLKETVREHDKLLAMLTSRHLPPTPVPGSESSMPPSQL